MPAGRSCFQPSRTHRANTVVHSVNLQMQVFKKKKKKSVCLGSFGHFHVRVHLHVSKPQEGSRVLHFCDNMTTAGSCRT